MAVTTSNNNINNLALILIVSHNSTCPNTVAWHSQPRERLWNAIHMNEWINDDKKFIINVTRWEISYFMIVAMAMRENKKDLIKKENVVVVLLWCGLFAMIQEIIFFNQIVNL